ncbi:uncharacterized protein Osi10a [Maniola hyperantus]|uniref:uncharacterized protein Osi10a n=1 Tax=Aphantopus hyperantus TaxID=2795564 RepID=UPI001568AB3E|nr:uncharacterized protein LOC117993417 [Maniola hyperantus]
MIRNLPLISVIVLSIIVEIIPIQHQLQNGGEVKRNGVEGSALNECLSDRSEVGVCFGKELLYKLNDYDETDSFSLVTGVSFIRDEKLPRDIGSFLDKDPLDFRSIIEDASGLISKRSLHWDLGKLYPGLSMRIGPTLANGVLEFVMDPRVKDRSYQLGQMTTGRLLTRNLLLPFLLGIKFHIATLLPILLGLVLLASKKAFLLAKIALFAVTLFTSGGSNFTGEHSFFESYINPESTSSTPSEHNGYHHNYHSSGAGGYYRDHKYHHHHGDYEDHSERYYYKEKSDVLDTTLSPITPGELRDRLAKLFITKNDNINSPREDGTNARNYAWTPINGG